MKKRILIATSLLVILIIGSISVYATSFESNIDIMEKVGQLFKSHKEKSDNSIFAKGKSGGIITKDDIEQATEFYILAGYTSSSACAFASSISIAASIIASAASCIRSNPATSSSRLLKARSSLA